MRFLVLGGWYGSGNVGDDAILLGVSDLFRELDPDAEVVALSTDPAQTRETCGVESFPLMSPRGYLRDPDQYKRVFGGVDAVLVTGGTPFYDWDHASRLVHMWLARREKPLFCLGVGAKRIDSPHGLLLTSLLLRQAGRISARDPQSQRRLGGLTGGKVQLTGDSALWMRPSSMRASRRTDGDPGGGVVVIAPRALDGRNRPHYHDPISEELIRRVRAGLAGLADGLIDAGYRVVLLPMHDSPADDDTFEIGAVTFRMRHAPITVSRPLPPRECAAFLGSARLVVGLRLHALILASSLGVPVLGVGYDEKIAGFMEYAGAADCVVAPEELPRRAFELLGDGGGVGGRLLHSCAAMKERIREEAKTILSAVSG